MEYVETIDTIYGKFRRSSKRRLDIAYDSESPEIAFFHKLTHMLGAEVVIDIGANIGLYSIHSLSLPDVRKIVAIEASAQTYAELVANLELQSSPKEILSHRVAASDRETTLAFHEYGLMAGHNSLAETSFIGPRPDSHLVEVPTRRLDQLLSDRGRILAVKIDVEGHERQVLEGAVELLKHSTGFLQIEIVSKENLSGIRNHLAMLGYDMFGSIKNDYYFLHRTHGEQLEDIRTLMFAEIRAALSMLRDVNMMRRRVLRACRKIGSDAQPIQKIASFKGDPIIRK